MEINKADRFHGRGSRQVGRIILLEIRAQLVSLQRILEEQYQEDKFLVNRLMAVIEIPSIQSGLRDRLPNTRQNIIKSLCIRLRDRKRTAGGDAICVVTKKADYAHCSLGQ